MSKGKKFLIILCALALITLTLAVFNPYMFSIVTDISDRKLLWPVGTTYIEYYQSIADKYGFTIGKVTGARNRVISLYSEDFADIDDAKKLAFIAEYKKSGDIRDQFGEEHRQSTVKIYSQGNEYRAAYSNTMLYEGTKPIYSTSKKSSSSSSSSSYSSSGAAKRYRCNQCGGDGRTHDWGTEMHGSGHTCWKCKGDGYIDPND